ncbi:hypothetical protein JZ751_006279 [Albula glossodonta]|uniref:Nuclear transcription factor Y subunit beta n=1 Tax=Albula glossodonta TaxID=121402 RepID=A0A8T2N4W4_9TELE|nr:hypothetical protein JZ751_006279 [Albula glossodonta]
MALGEGMLMGAQRERLAVAHSALNPIITTQRRVNFENFVCNVSIHVHRADLRVRRGGMGMPGVRGRESGLSSPLAVGEVGKDAELRAGTGSFAAIFCGLTLMNLASGMDGDSSTTDASQLGMSGEYMSESHYVLQSQEDDGEEELHEDGNGSKDNFREQDIYLPIANVARIMKSAVPQTGKIAKDAKECVQECVSEFISFITSEASERCHQEKRKTINGEDILFAMSTLGFDMYVEPLKLYLQKFREAMKGEKGITAVTMSESLGEEITEDTFTNQLPAGIITADGQQQNVMVYTTSYQQVRAQLVSLPQLVVTLFTW